MARILVVDDYESVRMLITKALESDGHTITPAANGAEAIAIFVEHPHDLVITDMEMPFLNGPELIAEVQQLAPSTPIIGMTGGPLPEPIEAEQQRLRIAALYAKPMDLGTLRKKVYELTTGQNTTTTLAA